MSSNPAALAYKGGVPLSLFGGAANPLASANTAAGASGIIYLDIDVALGADTTLTAKLMGKGGVITLGSHNLTCNNAVICEIPYMRMFNQAGTGIVSLGKLQDVWTNWWGADPTNNTNSAAQILTRQAFQAAVLSLDALGQAGTGAASYWSAAGIYRLDVSIPVAWRHGGFKAVPRTVRIDFDPLTVPSSPTNPVGVVLLSNCIFGTGDPTTIDVASGFPYRAGQTTLLTGTTAPIGTFTGPANLVWWDGVDIISYNTTTLTGTKSLSGIYFQFAQPGSYVRNSRFIGMPNDGCHARFSNGCLFENLICWLNGFYGPANTNNGLSISGFWDITVPTQTSRGHIVSKCDLRYNKDEGLEFGMSAQTIISNCVIEGNQDKQMEGDTAVATPICVWLPLQNYSSTTHDTRYNGTNLYQCITSGLSAGSGGPTGTGSNIIDGTVHWKFVGVMPEDGCIPEDFTITGCSIGGAFPSTVTVDGNSVSIPNPRGFNRGRNGITIGSGNEGKVIFADCSIYDIGDTTLSDNLALALGLGYTNGGDILVSNVTVDNFYIGTGSGPVVLGSGSSTFPGPQTGGNARQFGRLVVDGLHTSNINCTVTAGVGQSEAIFAGACYREWRFNNITNDTLGLVRNLMDIQINGANVLACQVDEFVVSNCFNGGCTGSPILLNIPNAATITNAKIHNCRFLGNNSAGGGDGFLRIQGNNNGSSTFTISELEIEDCVASYAGATKFPVIYSNTTVGAIGSIRAVNNKFDTGSAFKLNFGSTNANPSIQSAAVASEVSEWMNGIPSEKVTYGTATPSSGTSNWWKGDQQYRRTPAASGVYTDVCTTSGSFGTAYSGITGTTDGVTAGVQLSSITNVVIGQVITITGAAGPWRITSTPVVSPGITQLSGVPASVAGAAVSLNAPVFKQVATSA